jgi:hypothetical protein
MEATFRKMDWKKRLSFFDVGLPKSGLSSWPNNCRLYCMPQDRAKSVESHAAARELQDAAGLVGGMPELRLNCCFLSCYFAAYVRYSTELAKKGRYSMIQHQTVRDL